MLQLTEKMGSLKQIIWQLQAAKVRRWCGEIAADSGPAWRRLSPVGSSYSELFSSYCPCALLKPFSELRIM
jgi:hypothetical protein